MLFARGRGGISVVNQSFVAALLQSRSSKAIVQSSVSLGHDLGLEVVAQGVESLKARRLLPRAGDSLRASTALS